MTVIITAHLFSITSADGTRKFCCCCPLRHTNICSITSVLTQQSRVHSTVLFLFNSYRWFPNQRGVSGFGVPPTRRRAPQEQAGGGGGRHNWGQGFRLGEDWGCPTAKLLRTPMLIRHIIKHGCCRTQVCISLGFGSVFISLLLTMNEKRAIAQSSFTPRQRVCDLVPHTVTEFLTGHKQPCRKSSSGNVCVKETI